MKEQPGAQLLVDALENAGSRCVFGVPGTQLLPLFEALRQSRLRTVLATNELGAAFMAGGFARATGDPGIVVTIPGPGFTWALTGIAEALLDSIPLVHIAGAPVDDPPGRSGRLQELAQAAIATPLVKTIVEAESYPSPASAALDALRLARSGEPGPVLLHVSTPALKKMVPSGGRIRPHLSVVEPGGLAEVSARLAAARKPVFIFGQGANAHAALVCELAERLNAPVLTTPSARGLLPEDHRLSFAFDPFVADITDVNELFEACDLVVAMSCKLGHNSSGGFELRLPADRFVHVDASSEVVGVNYPASLQVVADVGDVLAHLLSSDLHSSGWVESDLRQWRARLLDRSDIGAEPTVAGTVGGSASGFFECLRRVLPRDGILVLDSGLHQVLARRYFKVFAAGGLIMPTDLQSMGFAIPTAIGARMAVTRPVVALLGDGGFAMTGLELLTAVREKIPMVAIVFVDGALGQIRMQQLADYGTAYGVSLRNPDLRLFAEAIGARYELVDDASLDSVLGSALESADVTIVEVRVGDTFRIMSRAAMIRTSEATRRIAPLRLTRFLRWLFRRR